jgi:hypothetical protein
VSYSHREPERTWVRQTLAPALQRHGLRICLDADDFTIGGYVEEEMERGVTNSRSSLVVVTEAAFTSGFCELEWELSSRVLAVVGVEVGPGIVPPDWDVVGFVLGDVDAIAAAVRSRLLVERP